MQCGGVAAQISSRREASSADRCATPQLIRRGVALVGHVLLRRASQLALCATRESVGSVVVCEPRRRSQRTSSECSAASHGTRIDESHPPRPVAREPDDDTDGARKRVSKSRIESRVAEPVIVNHDCCVGDRDVRQIASVAEGRTGTAPHNVRFAQGWPDTKMRNTRVVLKLHLPD